MKRIILLIIILSGISFITAAQTTETGIFRQEGIASWYGPEFDGKPTASGELFYSSLYTAAHPTLPFGTILKVTNLQNMRVVNVRINDRGPFVHSRIIDLSRAAAEALDMITTSLAFVSIEEIVSTGLGPATEFSQTFNPPPAAFIYVPPEAPVESPVQTPAQAPIIIYSLPQVSESSALNSIEENIIDPIPAIVNTQTPVSPVIAAPPSLPARLTGADIETGSGKLYRLQVASFSVPRNAVDTFVRLSEAGLTPNYERHENYYRVVLANVREENIPAIAQTLGNLGYAEVIVRVENQNPR